MLRKARNVAVLANKCEWKERMEAENGKVKEPKTLFRLECVLASVYGIVSVFSNLVSSSAFLLPLIFDPLPKQHG